MPPADVQSFTFFIDRSLGSGIVATALRDAGEGVVIHDAVFAADTADVTRLAEAGQVGLGGADQGRSESHEPA